jgi:hypothetical protein
MHSEFAVSHRGLAVFHRRLAVSQSGFIESWNRFALSHTAVQERFERFGASPGRPAALSSRIGASLGGRGVAQRRLPEAGVSLREDEDLSCISSWSRLGRYRRRWEDRHGGSGRQRGSRRHHRRQDFHSLSAHGRPDELQCRSWAR